MNVLQKLTMRHLGLNRKRTIVTLIAIALSVAMVTAVSGLVVSFQDMLYREAVERRGDWHVLYNGLDPALAAQIAEEDIFQNAYTQVDEDWDGVTLVMQFRKLDRHIFTQSEQVCLRYGIDMKQVHYHNDLLIAKGLMPGGYFDAIYGFAAVLFVLIGAGSVIVICNAFTISADQRSVQFGLLKSVGATNRQIRGMVFFEGMVLCALAIPLGILFGLFAEWVALSIANYVFTTNPFVSFNDGFRVVTSPLALGVSVAAALLTVLLAAWLPARRAARTSPVEAIRQNRAIRIRPRSVRVRLPIARLFGFEGLLAAKTMKRNRRGYRTTVISLVVSIVLFIGVSGFGQLLLKATSMVYGDYGSNLSINLNGGETAWQDELADGLRALSDDTIYSLRSTPASTYLPDEKYTAMGREYYGSGEAETYAQVNIVSVSAENFRELCAAQRLDPEAMADTDSPQAILINTTDTFIRDGRYTNFTPFTLRAGDSLLLDYEQVELRIAGVIDEVPPAVLPQFEHYAVNLIVAEPVRAAVAGPDSYNALHLAVFAVDADAFEALADEYLADKIPPDGVMYLTNFEAMARSNRSFGYLVMTFVYGFVAMLSLIAVTSVITTISTGIALRGRELAMLRSVGMTGKNLDRMLNYESLLYALKALVIGIPLGIAACALMFRALNGALDFVFEWPVSSVIVSIAAVLLLSFATSIFARRKQREVGIVDALRMDMI